MSDVTPPHESSDGTLEFGSDRADRAPRGDGALLPRLRHVGHRQPRAARRARRPEAGAPAHPLRHVRSGLPSRSAAREVRAGHGQRGLALASARHERDLRRAHPHGPAVLAAPSAHRLPRQLRLTRLRRGRRALHRVPSLGARHAADGRHRRRHGQLHRQLLGRVPRPRGAPGPLPEPAGQRQPGHRGRHGHEHPAAQPRRGHRRGRST